MELTNASHSCSVFEEAHLSTCKLLPGAREQVQDITPIGCKRKISESSCPPRGSLGTQVDSTSLRTPVTLKSLSTAYHKRRSVDAKGASCSTIPDTRSTASRPDNKVVHAKCSIEGHGERQTRVQQERPVSCTEHIEEQVVATGNCLTASAAAHSSDHGPHDSVSAGGATNACDKVDTSRVLFTSPQASIGLSAPSSSPTGGENQGLGATTGNPHPEPSQRASTRELTESEQQFLLTQELDEEPEYPTQRPPNATLRRLHSCPHPAQLHSKSQSCPWEIVMRRKDLCGPPASVKLQQPLTKSGSEQVIAEGNAPCAPQPTRDEHHDGLRAHPPAVPQSTSPIENSSSMDLHPLNCVAHSVQAATNDRNCLGQENCAQVGNCQISMEEVANVAKEKVANSETIEIREAHPQTVQIRLQPDAEHLRMPCKAIACGPDSEDPVHGRTTPAIAVACDASAQPIPLLSPARCSSMTTLQQDCKQEMQTVVGSSAVPTSDFQSDQQLAAGRVHQMERKQQGSVQLAPAISAATYSQAHVGQIPQHDAHASHNCRMHQQHTVPNGIHSMSGQEQQAYRAMVGTPRSCADVQSPAAHASAHVTQAATPGAYMSMQHCWVPMENQSGPSIPPSGMSHMPAGGQFVSPMHPYSHQQLSAHGTFMMGSHPRQQAIPQGYGRQSPFQPQSGQQLNPQCSMQQYMFQQGQQQMLQGGKSSMMPAQLPAVGAAGMPQQNGMNPGMKRGFTNQVSPYVPTTGFMPQNQAHIYPHQQQQHQHWQQYQHPDRAPRMNGNRYSMPTPNSHVGLYAVPPPNGVVGMSSAPTTVPVSHGARRDYGSAFPGAPSDDAQTAMKKAAISSLGSPAGSNVTPPLPGGMRSHVATTALSPLDARSAPAGHAVTPIQTPPTFSAAAAAPLTEQQPPQCKPDMTSARSACTSTPQPIWGRTTTGPAHSVRKTGTGNADTASGGQQRTCVHKEPGSHAEGKTEATKMMSAEEVKELQERAQSGMSESERQEFLDSCWLLSNEVAPEAVPSSRKGKGLAKVSEDTRSFSLRRTAGGGNKVGPGAAQQPHQVPRRQIGQGRRGGQCLDSFGLFSTAADATCDAPVAPPPAEQAPVQPGGESNHTDAPSLVQNKVAHHEVPGTSDALQKGGTTSVQNPSAAGSRRTPAKRSGASVVAGQNRSRSGFNCPRAAAVQRAEIQAAGAVEPYPTGSGAGEQGVGVGTANTGMRQSAAAGARIAVRTGGIAAAVASAGTEGAVVATGFVRGGSGSAVMAPQSRVTAARQNRLLHDTVCQDEQ